jgi:hypothetical protein
MPAHHNRPALPGAACRLPPSLQLVPAAHYGPARQVHPLWGETQQSPQKASLGGTDVSFSCWQLLPGPPGIYIKVSHCATVPTNFMHRLLCMYTASCYASPMRMQSAKCDYTLSAHDLHD